MKKNTEIKVRQNSGVIGVALDGARQGEYVSVGMFGDAMVDNGKFTYQYAGTLGIFWDEEKYCDYCNKKGCFSWSEMDLNFCKKCLKKFVSKEKPIGKIIRKV